MKRHVIHLLMILFLLITAMAPTAPALQKTVLPVEETEPRSPAEQAYEEYLARVTEKFDYGILNSLMGWTELITQTIDQYQEPQAVGSFSRWFGIGRGISYAVIDTLGGFLNAATALIPHKIPLPQDGVNHKRLTSSLMPPLQE